MQIVLFGVPSKEALIGEWGSENERKETNKGFVIKQVTRWALGLRPSGRLKVT